MQPHLAMKVWQDFGDQLSLECVRDNARRVAARHPLTQNRQDINPVYFGPEHGLIPLIVLIPCDSNSVMELLGKRSNKLTRPVSAPATCP